MAGLDMAAIRGQPGQFGLQLFPLFPPARIFSARGGREDGQRQITEAGGWLLRPGQNEGFAPPDTPPPVEKQISAPDIGEVRRELAGHVRAQVNQASRYRQTPRAEYAQLPLQRPPVIT